MQEWNELCEKLENFFIKYSNRFAEDEREDVSSMLDLCSTALERQKHHEYPQLHAHIAKLEDAIRLHRDSLASRHLTSRLNDAAADLSLWRTLDQVQCDNCGKELWSWELIDPDTWLCADCTYELLNEA